jgi:hypothetical protein
MADIWEIDGPGFSNCVCDWGCPCQFGAKSTHGYCEALVSGRIDTGHFNGVGLDGLAYVLLAKWPGEIADGNGTQQAFIDVRADEAQRDALVRIIYGSASAPMSSHFFVYNAMCTTVLDPEFVSIDLAIDIDGRTSHARIGGVVTSEGRPILNRFTGEPVFAGIHLPGGFEYSYAQMGRGSTTTTTEIELSFTDSYGAFNRLHLNQDGVVRHPLVPAS